MGKVNLPVRKVSFQQEDMEMKWYTVMVNFQYERKVADALKARFKSMGAEHLLDEILVPLMEIPHVTPKGKKTVKFENPYGSLIYVRMCMTNHTWNIVRQTTGVAGWLNMDGRPGMVSDEEILQVKRVIGLEDKLKEEAIKAFNGKAGDITKIKDHAMAGVEVEIIEVNKDKGIARARVVSNSIPLEVKLHQLESIK